MSEWSHHFRMSYLHLPVKLRGLGVPLIGLTATCTTVTRRYIQRAFGVTEEGVVMHGIVRDNLKMSVSRCDGNR